jgi:large subunit ribosomal protein L13
MYTQKTFHLKANDVEKNWHLVDAEGLTVGRLATELATILRGKNKPTFTPHIDSGDYVVVVNAEKVNFTGKKWEDKIYYRHTNHVGGLKKRTAKEQLERDASEILMKAVKGMLPKTSLGRKQLTKLKVVVGTEHKYEAQKPQTYTIK